MPTIRVSNFSVDCHEAGTGLPVIFVPGITEFKEEFVYQFHGLSSSYRAISYDLRRGLKRTSDYTMEMLSDDLCRLVEALGLSSAVVCGHSFGGLVAIDFALRHPDMTMALVLSSAYPAAPPITPQQLLAWTSAASHPYHKGLSTGIKMQIGRILGRSTTGMLAMTDQVSAVRTVARQAAGTTKTTIEQRLRIIQHADYTDRLQDLGMPTLVIAGAKDRAVFLSSAQQLYQGIPNSTLEVIEGAGHFCFLTRHDEFNTVLDEFLTSHLAEIS